MTHAAVAATAAYKIASGASHIETICGRPPLKEGTIKDAVLAVGTMWRMALGKGKKQPSGFALLTFLSICVGQSTLICILTCPGALLRRATAGRPYDRGIVISLKMYRTFCTVGRPTCHLLTIGYFVTPRYKIRSRAVNVIKVRNILMFVNLSEAKVLARTRGAP